jgi:hypothetical protein
LFCRREGQGASSPGNFVFWKAPGLPPPREKEKPGRAPPSFLTFHVVSRLCRFLSIALACVPGCLPFPCLALPAQRHGRGGGSHRGRDARPRRAPQGADGRPVLKGIGTRGLPHRRLDPRRLAGRRNISLRWTNRRSDLTASIYGAALPSSDEKARAADSRAERSGKRRLARAVAGLGAFHGQSRRLSGATRRRSSQEEWISLSHALQTPCCQKKGMLS